MTLTRKWAARSSSSDNPAADYPDNMYSTSYIRVHTLNAGGQYSTSGTALSGVQGQDSNSPYARFTMISDVSNSLTAYIAKPSEVGYQADEYDKTTATIFSDSHYAPNDAYTSPKSGGEWRMRDVTSYNYGLHSNPTGELYGVWQNDYVWLPSITETGCGTSGTGYWKTDATLRNSGTTPIWLRSGDDDWAANAYALEPTGNNQHYYVD